jgi:hypothetical protein
MNHKTKYKTSRRKSSWLFCDFQHNTKASSMIGKLDNLDFIGNKNYSLKGTVK